MRVTQAQVCSTDVKWRKLVVCESAVDTSNVAEEALEVVVVVVIVVAKIKAVTLVDTDIMAHSLCQVPVANTQLSDSLHTSVVVRPVSFGTKPQNPKLTNPKQFWAKLLDPKPKN